MKRQSYITTLLLCWLTALHLWSQPTCSVTRYDEADGVSSAHVTQLLQDEQGFMWFATWNGLCRYDGYEFHTFKPQVGDGCHMLTDRIRNITLLPQGRMICQVDFENYLFDLNTYRFRDLTKEEQQLAEHNDMKYRQSRSLQRKPFTWTDQQHTQWTLNGSGQLTYLDNASGQQTSYPLANDFHTLTFAAPDNQGNLWALDHESIYRFTTNKQPTKRLDIEPKSEVKCLFSDGMGYFFVSTKSDKAVRVYSSKDEKLLGYLGADGRLHPSYTTFGAAVYCMHKQKDGTLWLGTKPDGLFRLQPTGAKTYKIDHFIDIPHRDIYHITEDRWGRIWVATLGGGIFYFSQSKTENPHFIVPKQYPKDAGQRARYIYITKDDVMLVATGDGLMVAKIEQNAENMRFQRHQREHDRQNSLSCNATMDIVQSKDAQSHCFISTESGGVNQIEGNDLLAQRLNFLHFNEKIHVQGNEIVQSLTATQDGGLIAVGSHLVTMIDSSGHARVLDEHFFNKNYRFSEAHPLRLSDSRWLFGLTDGAFVTTDEKMQNRHSTPKLVLTHISIQGGQSTWTAEKLDTLTLQPHERSLTVHFAALDFGGAARINYAFRLSKDKEWSYIGHNRSAILLDLEPGTYQLEIRSTNADGEWQDNVRKLTIIAKPTFWEAWYGQLIIILLILGVLTAIVRTILYIRRIKRQHRETLEKYLALIGTKNKEQEEPLRPSDTKPQTTEFDPTIRRVMKFVEENIGNGNASVGEMAQAAAVSRSGLQRKLKQAMGITPQDLMREARIKRACQLLRETDKTVSEVAYVCGFTDPKYFSRSFRQSIGKTPTEYKNMS